MIDITLIVNVCCIITIFVAINLYTKVYVLTQRMSAMNNVMGFVISAVLRFDYVSKVINREQYIEALYCSPMVDIDAKAFNFVAANITFEDLICANITEDKNSELYKSMRKYAVSNKKI